VVGKAPVLGVTTAGEICDSLQQGSVVVVALASPHLHVRVGVGERVSRDWQRAVAQAVSAPEIGPFFSPQDGDIWPELTRQGKAAFALLFSPGDTGHADSRSYEILEELKRLSAGLLPIFGGSAADDWRMEENYVLLGQRAYPDSVLVAVFETRLRFGIALAHGFRPGPAALRKALLRSGGAASAAILLFSCALRARILGERTGEEISGIKEMVPGVPMVGVHSFGEQGRADGGVNRHGNEVVTVLVLGRELAYAAQVALENERLREEMRESEARYRALVENINDVILPWISRAVSPTSARS